IPEQLMLGAVAQPFALSALKYGLLALLFLFIWRAMRWVVRGLNVDRPPPSTGGDSRAATSPARPSMLLVQADGQKARSVRLAGSATIGRGLAVAPRLGATTSL